MKIAFLTGAGGDIGRAIALKLAEQGYHIACVDYNQAGNDATVSALAEQGGMGTAITADIADEKQVNDAVQQAKSLGEVQVIINNAGLCRTLNQQGADYSQWRLEQDVNLNSIFLITKAFETDITGGTVTAIVNTSSVNGMGVYGNTAYSVAKAGMIHYTRQLAVEFGKYGCLCELCCPRYCTYSGVG